MQGINSTDMLSDRATCIQCPVCGGQTVHHCPAPNWGEMRRCLSCGLVASNPLVMLKDATVLFEEAYQGKVHESDMLAFQSRLKIANDQKHFSANKAGPTHMALAIKWLRENVPPGSLVLDIGCSTGVFMSKLKKAGFEPYGLEVSETVVKSLRTEGYNAFHGTVDDLPPDFPQPAACTCFHVIHHVTDPIAFLRSIRSHFPQAPLLLTDRVSDLHKKPTPSGFPPRTLTWWTEKAFEVTMKRAGYSPAVYSPAPRSSDYGVAPFLNELWIKLRSSMPFVTRFLRFYFYFRSIIFAPKVILERLKNKRTYFFIIALPSKQEG